MADWGTLSFKKGWVIHSEGELAEMFFIIQDGNVRISRKVPISPMLDNRMLKTGDFFGAVSAVTARSHSNTATAETDVSVIAIKKNQFQDIAQTHKSIAMKVLLEFSSLIRGLNEALMLPPESVVPGGVAVKENYIASEAKVRQYAADSVIFREGDRGDELFIIQRGTVKLTKNINNKEVTLSYIKTGEMFGEMGLLESKPRSANAYAYEECEITVINGDSYKQIILSQPQIFLKMAVQLADRVWFLSKQLANRKIQDPVDRIRDMLAVNLERNNIPARNSGYMTDFNSGQLIEMCGVGQKAGTVAVEALISEGAVKVDEGRIHINNTAEIYRANEIFWKLRR
ncbi:MAG: cyclic nucleotide-binding domain-containing protein [Spirochaetaceae bacterium]|jgi:CRP-like cAMP-binding protein|nr:cyclic nucleotide-binding domain-containing protein [Spirochaetaceae bacterium]